MAFAKSIFLASLLAAAAAGQSGPAFRSGVELVTIPCAVVDAQGAPVRGLTREDFRVFDNDVPRLVTQFWSDDNQPLAIGVLIDNSESQDGQLEEHRRTALDLLERILRPGDRAFVVSVAEDVTLWADLTGPAGDLPRLLSANPSEPFGQPCAKRGSNAPGVRPMSVCGASPLWNAVYDAARFKLRQLRGAKALLVLTDGFDSGSLRTWGQAADEVHKSEAAVYAIEYPSKLGGRYTPALYRLVTETGGAWFQPPAGRYDAIVSRLDTDLRRRYVLAFRPDPLPTRMRHEVRVEIRRPELTVRARSVYFDPGAVEMVR